MKYETLLIFAILSFILIQNLYSQEKQLKEITPSPSDGIELKLDGLIVCDENGDRIHSSSLKEKFDENSTVKDVVNILGPGYLPEMSGTGNITWFFDDSSKIITGLWPDSLNSKIKLIYKTPED